MGGFMPRLRPRGLCVICSLLCIKYLFPGRLILQTISPVSILSLGCVSNPSPSLSHLSYDSHFGIEQDEEKGMFEGSRVATCRSYQLEMGYQNNLIWEPDTRIRRSFC